MDGPEAIMIVLSTLAVFVGMPWAVFSGIAKMRAAGRGERGDELRRSELEAMIAEAVAEVEAPLRRRVEALEAIVTDDEPGEARLDPAVLAGALDAPVDEAEEPAAVRRRARS